jgi:hypothetical protein
MKKILVAITLLMFCIVPVGLFAEHDAIDKGSVEFGLGTAFDLSLYFGNVEATEFTIGSGGMLLSVGYFVIDKLSIGGAAYFRSLKYKAATESYTEFGFGPEVKYYIPASDQVLANLKGLFQIVSWESPGDIDRSSQIWFGGGGAVTYLMTGNLGIYGGADIVFSPNYSDQGTKVPDSSYTLIAVEVGFRVFL